MKQIARNYQLNAITHFTVQFPQQCYWSLMFCQTEYDLQFVVSDCVKPRSHYDALHPARRMQCIVVWTAPLNNMAGVIADAYAVLIRSTSRMHTA